MYAHLRNALLAFLLLLLLPPAVFAQNLTFGQPFAVTNTRYGTAQALPVLRTNGRETFVFWIDNVLRVTRYEKGERRLGLPVFDIPMNEFSHFDAVWTGDHFVVVTHDSHGRIIGRIVDDNGRPQGETFTIVDGGSFPSVAFNGKYILLVYFSNRTYSLALKPDGHPASFEPQIIGFTFSFPAHVASNGNGFIAIVPDDGDQLWMFDQNAQPTVRRRLGDVTPQRSLTSDGQRYLSVESRNGNMNAMVIGPDGTLGSTFVFDQSTDNTTFTAPAAAWTSAGRWAIAYTASSTTKTELRIAELDFVGQQVVSRTTGDAAQGTIMTIGSRGVAAWPDRNGRGAYIGDLPLDVSKGEPVTYAPADQRVLATTTSADGTTLIVWQETGDGHVATRAGVRMSDGRWRERELPASGGVAVAANDGHEFMVVVNQTAVRLNAEGEVVPGGTSPVSAFRPDGIAWNGSNYGIIGMKDGAVVTALLSPAGTVSNVTTVPFSAGVSQSPFIASNGSGFYVAWFTPNPSQLCDPACPPRSVAAIHLDSQLHSVDPSPTLFGGSEDESIFGGALTWNDGRYVLVFSSSKQGIVAARVGTTGGVTSLSTVASQAGFGLAARPTAGGVAIGWHLSQGAEITGYVVAVLRNDGTIDGPRLIHSDTTFPWSKLEALSGGRVAYIFSTVQNNDPYKGASHVMMQVGSLALPQRPDAPEPTIAKDLHRIRVTWTAPPQPVTGYRVEYKVLDGTVWNEFDQWHDPDQRVMVFVPPAENAVYAFRIRAFNDAGAGSYSAAVSLNSLRRRSVR